MMRWLSLFWFKQMLMERSKRHRLGYEWALRELHQDRDPEVMLEGHTDCFDQGAMDAVRDWKSSVDADSMWAKAAEDDLERTQKLPICNTLENDPLENTQELDILAVMAWAEKAQAFPNG